jgi:methionyl-tRNA formyltransferase
MRETPIGPEENALELGARLAVMGAALLVETLRGWEAGTIVPRPQENALATLAPILKKEDGRIDWTLPARQIDCRIRGFQPWPGGYTTFRGQGFHIAQARVWSHTIDVPPGRIFDRNGALLVSCGQTTALELIEVQLEGRKKMAAGVFKNGQRLVEYEVLGENQL